MYLNGVSNTVDEMTVSPDHLDGRVWPVICRVVEHGFVTGFQNPLCHRLHARKRLFVATVWDNSARQIHCTWAIHTIFKIANYQSWTFAPVMSKMKRRFQRGHFTLELENMSETRNGIGMLSHRIVKHYLSVPHCQVCSGSHVEPVPPSSVNIKNKYPSTVV